MSGLPIIPADQRMAERRGIKGVLVGPVGIGKTSQLWTLDPETTLFFDLEAGDLAVEGWPGDTIRPRTWDECRDFAVFIGGPNPALRSDQYYSTAHYQAVVAQFGDPAIIDKYHTIFVDSITVAGRLCFQWCKGQPQAFSEKSGKPDLRGAYGLLGQEMIGWLTHLQHTRNKNIFFVGILNKLLDDFNRPYFSLQLEGSKTGLELPGIVDQVMTLAELPTETGQLFRAFICHTLNPWGFPAKDRSGRLAMVEEPHLGRLMAKMNAAWQDFNDADTQDNFDLLPKGLVVPVRMTIKPGGIDDLSRGWTGGYATRARESDAVYLNCEFVITAGEHAKRKVWSLIGLYSPKGPEWGNMGRAFVRAILNSARGLSDKDTSPRALEARRIRGFADLDGIEFLAKVDVEKDANGNPKNVIKMAITPDMKEYQGLQTSATSVAAIGFQPPAAFQPATTFQPPAAAPVANGWRPAQQQAVPAQGFQQNAAPAQSPPQGFQQNTVPAQSPQQVAPAQGPQNGAGGFARPAWAQ